MTSAWWWCSHMARHVESVQTEAEKWSRLESTILFAVVPGECSHYPQWTTSGQEI